MMNDSRVDQRVIAVLDAALREQLTHLRQRVEPLHSVTAVAIAAPIVCPGDVVEVDGRPESRRFLRPAGRLEQTESVHHHTRHVGLSMERARVRKQFYCGHQAGERQRDRHRQHRTSGVGCARAASASRSDTTRASSSTSGEVGVFSRSTDVNVR
jgi:hypothetical protein